MPLRFTQNNLNGPQRNTGNMQTAQGFLQKTALRFISTNLNHFVNASACRWQEPGAKLDTDAHVILVANHECLIVKLTPDLETDWPVGFQLQV